MQDGTDPAPGTLYLVPTPIGNPRDLTLRAIDVLTAAGTIACEDTRNTHTLLRPLGISTPLLSYHEHNEEARGRQLLGMLREGTDVALVSDAGTPLVNDPGYRLVTEAIRAGVPIRPLPGANAPITALIASGLPVHQFHYVGFLPRKSAARRAALEPLRRARGSLLLFEAPHRLAATLTDLRDVLGDRAAALARNLTKDDEDFLRGRISELLADVEGRETVRGQYTLVVGEEQIDDEDADPARILAGDLAESFARHGAPTKLAREVIQEVTGLPRNWVYDRVQRAGAS